MAWIKPLVMTLFWLAIGFLLFFLTTRSVWNSLAAIMAAVGAGIVVGAASRLWKRKRQRGSGIEPPAAT